MKIFYEIEILNWGLYNKKSTSGMKSIMVSKRFFDDPAIQTLPGSGKLLYLFLLLRRGDHDTSLFVCSHEDCVTSAGGRGVLVATLLDQMQSLRLLRYEKTTPKGREGKERKLIEAEGEAPPPADPGNFSWFSNFVTSELGTIDTGLLKLGPKVKQAFVDEKTFREWLAGLTEAPAFQQKTRPTQLRYFAAAVRKEVETRLAP